MSKFIIEIEIDGDEDAASAAIDSALDAGVLQDYINDYDHDEGPLEVSSAVVKGV